MAKKKETTKKAVSKKDYVAPTDIWEDYVRNPDGTIARDEDGNRKIRRVFMKDKKKLYEEVRNG